MPRNGIDNTFASETRKHQVVMKNMWSILLLVCLLFLSSCVKMAEPVHSDFRLERQSQNLYGNPVQIRFNSKKVSDAGTRAKAVSDRCENGMMRWADYSALDTTP